MQRLGIFIADSGRVVHALAWLGAQLKGTAAERVAPLEDVDLDGGGGIAIGVGVLHLPGELGADESLIRIHTVTFIAALPGPG